MKALRVWWRLLLVSWALMGPEEDGAGGDGTTEAGAEEEPSAEAAAGPDEPTEEATDAVGDDGNEPLALGDAVVEGETAEAGTEEETLAA